MLGLGHHGKHKAASILAVLTACLTLGLAAETCVPPPVLMPIVNVTLSNDKPRRGVSLKIGQPPKEFSFLPNWNTNNTFVFGPTCLREDFITTDDACTTFRGGVYKPDDSSTKSAPNASYAPLPDPFKKSSYSLFTDQLTFDHFALPDFVLARPLNISGWELQAYNPQNMLGLARSSTLFAALANAGRILSNSYGFYWGLDGLSDKDQFPGSLVLGGYDRAKTIGNGYSQAMTARADCPTSQMVLITDLLLNFRGGPDVSIFSKVNGGTALQACLVPELPVLMELPLDPYFQNMLDSIDNDIFKVGRSIGIDWWNIILNTTNLYDGDFTIKLDSGFQVTIPNHELIFPDKTITNEGAIALNASRPVLRINSLQNTDALSMPRVGRYFFTAAYLMTNYDAGKFTLWQANPVNDVDLVAVDKTNAVVATNSSCQPTPKTTITNTGNTGNTGNTTEGNKPEDKSAGNPSSGLSPGAIAGVAVGVVALISAAGLLAWALIRRKKAKASAEAEAGDDRGSATPMSPMAAQRGEVTKPNDGYAYGYGQVERNSPGLGPRPRLQELPAMAQVASELEA